MKKYAASRLLFGEELVNELSDKLAQAIDDAIWNDIKELD